MSESNPTDWKIIIDGAQFLLSILIGLYLWITNRDKVTNSRISTFQEDVDERFDKQNSRLTRVEASIEHSPNRQSIGAVHSRLDNLQKEVAGMEGELKGMNKTVDLIHQSLMEQSKK